MTVDTKRLLDRVDVLEIRGEIPARIEALAYDSRKGGAGHVLRRAARNSHRRASLPERRGVEVRRTRTRWPGTGRCRRSGQSP